MKRHLTRNMGLRRQIEIRTVMTKTKIITNSQRVLEIYKIMIVTKITINTRGGINVKLFMVVLMKKHSTKVVTVRVVGIKTLMV